VAVSANNAETALNTEQTLDTSLLCSVNDVCNLETRRENNANELTGKEEADTIYDNGATAAMTLNFEKAQPQHFALLYAFGLGSVSTASEGNGYRHTITPLDGDLASDRSNPGFTLAQRFGKTVLKRRFASMFVNSVTATFTKDDWVKIVGELKGTGKYTDNVTEETITDGPDATSLTLAANGVEGATAAARLDNVQAIKAELTTGVWTDVSFSAVSDATPAVITISAPGVAGDDITYKVIYVPTESGWMSLPSRVTETPLRISEATVNFGGTWTGSAFSGGRTMSAEVNSIEHNLNNDMAIEFTFGGGGAYAARAFRNGRAQTLKLDREFRDFIIQQHIADNDTIGLQIVCTGAEFATGENYEVKLTFPKLGVLSAPISVNGKLLAEAGDLQVLEDDTYGSVIVEVLNQVATYAA
jgi:hypothetical protein